MATLTTDFAQFVRGDFIVENNTWNQGTLVNGVDFTQTVTYTPLTVPNGVTFAWDWPVPPNVKVYSYPEIIAGYKAWAEAGTSTLTAKVNDLKSFDVDFDLTIGGTKSGFNVAIEFWLTTKAKGTGEDITTEVMVWLHNPEYTPAGSKQGTYRDGAYSSDLWVENNMGDGSGESDHGWRYIALETKADYLKGSIDLHDVLVQLERQGLVDGDDYITGYEIGAEVFRDDGTLTVKSLSHDFAAHKITNNADTLTGTAKADNISGLGGDDKISGGNGLDWLNGGTGKDTITGGAKADRLSGGVGADTFRYLAPSEGSDSISYFSNIDRFAFKGSAFGNLTAGTTLAASKFQSNTSGQAEQSNDRFIFETDTDKLWYDPDGTGGKVRVLIADMNNNASIDASDIYIF